MANTTENGGFNITETRSFMKIFLQNWEDSVGNFVMGYINPAGVFLTLVNNLMVILVFYYGPQVKAEIPIQMRINYVALAFGDTSTSLPLHATYWLGKKNFLLTILFSVFLMIPIIHYCKVGEVE